MSTTAAEPTRRQHYSDVTKHGLVEVARGLFAEHGYAATSLDAIVAGAEVTKGALYHHFSGKQALFEAVFVEVEAAASAHIGAVVRAEDDPWQQAVAGIEAFVDVVRQPAYRRIVIQEGPAVLGYERFRELEDRSLFAHVREIVGGMRADSGRQSDDEMVETFSRLFVGAMSAAGEAVSSSPDPAAAAERVVAAISLILAGVRGLVSAEATSTRPDRR